MGLSGEWKLMRMMVGVGRREGWWVWRVGTDFDCECNCNCMCLENDGSRYWSLVPMYWLA